MKIRDCTLVVGTNCDGIHGKGAALTARNLFGLRLGVSEGFSGSTYALPTKITPYKMMSLPEIWDHITLFLSNADTNPWITFLVTRVATGLAGYLDKDIAPMFKSAPSNCILPAIWNIDNGNIGHHIELITKEDMDKEIW